MAVLILDHQNGQIFHPHSQDGSKKSVHLKNDDCKTIKKLIEIANTGMKELNTVVK